MSLRDKAWTGAYPSLTSCHSRLSPKWDHIKCWYRVWYFGVMRAARKITIEVPPELLEKAQKATGSGITQTVRTGLELVAASQAYERLGRFRGKVRLSRTFKELKDDR
jgi:hypothetical protein